MRPLARAARKLGLLAAVAEHDLQARLRAERYRASATPLCIVSHDAYRHGAQLLALELARIFARVLGLKLHIVLLGPGPLTNAFRRYGQVHPLDAQTGSSAQALANTLAAAGVRHALVSSTASGLFIQTLRNAGIRSVALVHELPGIIAERALEAHADAVRMHAATAVFPNAYVRDRFPGGAPANAIMRAQGLATRRRPPDAAARRRSRASLERRHAIPHDAILILNAGYGDLRKGLDLFVDIAVRVCAADPAVYFLWVGALDPDAGAAAAERVAKSGLANRIIFAPFRADLSDYYWAADLFALTSREDPFPTVLLEALDAGLPAIAFADSGGFASLLEQGGGALAPHADTEAFANQLVTLAADKGVRARMSEAAKTSVRSGYGMRRYALDLAHMLDCAPPRVSVVVPNYNYARYLPSRLASILDQTLPIYEIIVLDDCSSDDSIEVIQRTLGAADTDWRLVTGATKAATVFHQWRRGVEMAQGDFIWIAEADDLCAPTFLETACAALSTPDTVLSFTQSRQIDAQGRTLDRDYLTYVADIGAERWRAPYIRDGVDEIRTALAVKNTIPNVSACVFRKGALSAALAEADTISRFRIAGDWLAYTRVLQHGRIAFSPQALNHHRRHGASVTASALGPAEALREIEDMQRLIREEFSPSAETQSIAAAYLETLRRQFGLPPA